MSNDSRDTHQGSRQPDGSDDGFAPKQTNAPLKQPSAREEIASLRRTVELLGTIGSRREDAWQALFAKLQGRISQLEKRIAKRDRKLAEQAMAVDRHEHRTTKVRERVAEAEATIGQLQAELDARLPRARVRVKAGRTALISFDDPDADGAPSNAAPFPRNSSEESDQAERGQENRARPSSTIDYEETPIVPEGDPIEDDGSELDPLSPAWLAKERRRLLPGPAIGKSDAGVGRVVFYTAIVGAYDVLAEPAVFDVAADYVLFTDQPHGGDVWQARPFDERMPDPTRVARYVKLHPHRYFPDYDYAIWVDANLTLASTAEALIAPAPDADIVSWHHPQRDCVYDEAEACLALGKDDPDVIAAHIRRLRDQGYPEHAGLIESSVLLTRPQRPRVAAFMDDWWRAIVEGSRRDQLSFNPTLRAHPEIRLGYFAEPGINPKTDLRVLHRHHRGPGAKHVSPDEPV